MLLISVIEPRSALVAVALVVFAFVAACSDEGAAASAPAPGAGVAGAAAAGTPVATNPAPGAAVTPTSPAAASGAPSAQPGAAPAAPNAAAPNAAAPSAAAPTTSTAPGAAPTAAGSGNTLKVSIVIPKVAAGEEGTKCLQVKLPNTAAFNVVQLHNKLSNASHHFIVTALTDPAATEKPIADCMPFRGAIAGAPLAISQKHDDLVSLPAGVGYHLNASQVVHLELHYLNVSDTAVDVTGEAELIPADPSANLQEGAVLLVGTTDINIPPHMTHQNGPKFLALPKGMEDVEFYAVTGHTHRLGTNVSVSTAMNAMTPGQQIYEPQKFDWEAPEMKPLEPHVKVPAGGGFLLQCSWNNTTDATVTFGESALAEMCFFWGYYYPRKTVTSIVLDNINPDTLRHL